MFVACLPYALLFYPVVPRALVFGRLLYSPDSHGGHIKWPPARAELAIDQIPKPSELRIHGRGTLAAKFISWEPILRPMSTHLRHRLIKKRYRLFRYLFLACFYLAVAFLVSLQATGCFEFFDSVGLLPGKVGVFAAEVTVGCRLFVDGATQV